VVVLLLAVSAYVGSTTRLYMFWGGASAPARFLVPIIPCLAPMVAIAVSRARQPLWQGLIAMWAAIGVGVAAFSMIDPGRFVLYSEPHGRARILELFQAGSPLALTVPTFTDPDWAAHMQPLIWWLGLGAVVMLIAIALARWLRASAWALAAATALLFIVAGAVLTARPAADVRRATAQRGALEWLARYDGPRGRIANFTTLRKASFDEVRPLITVPLFPDAPLPDDGRVAGPVTLAPGHYEARIWFADSRTREGQLQVGAVGQAVFATASGELANPAIVPFEIPVTVGRLVVRAPAASIAAAVSRVDLVPVEVVPLGEREPSPIFAVESLPSRPGALIAYTDEWAYPEHGTFWTRGRAPSRVLIAPAGATAMRVYLSTGPLNSHITWRVDDARQGVTAVPGNDEVSVLVAVRPDERLIPMVLQASTEFRPGEVDPRSTDMRRLGVRVRIDFE
jgi:hypothetical protein